MTKAKQGIIVEAFKSPGGNKFRKRGLRSAAVIQATHALFNKSQRWRYYPIEETHVSFIVKAIFMKKVSRSFLFRGQVKTPVSKDEMTFMAVVIRPPVTFRCYPDEYRTTA